MASLNRVMLIGNAGKNAELQYAPNGQPRTKFSLAVNSRSKKGDEWEERTEWFNVVLWGDQAERVSQYITKGKPLYVEGRLQTRTWDDDKGQKHYQTEVVANSVQLLGEKPKGQGRTTNADVDDDLPF